MDALRWSERPTLRRPVLVAAFEGWNDAADAATTAARYLARSWSARPFAELDPEEFYDFTATRPQVRLDEGTTRHIEWPANTFASAALPGRQRDVVFLHGTEPQLRWRTFSDVLAHTARELGVELVVLQIASSAYERQVTELVEADDEAAAYVAQLEQADDEEDEMPSGDSLAAEVERFLRDHDD